MFSVIWKTFIYLFIFLLWICDFVAFFYRVRFFQESTEYEMITGFLQGFVDNEINLNKEHTCKNTCEDYRITRQYGCHNDTPCGFSLKNQRISKCRGILRNCEFIGSDLEICPSVREKVQFEYTQH